MKLREFKNKYPLNLQFFAEESTETGADNEPCAEADPSKAEPKTFDELLKDKAYQSEFDKRVAKALETARTKLESETEKKIETAKSEAEKLAKMSADEKAKFENEQREADLAKRVADLTARELKATAKETLAEKGLPLELANVLNYTDAEACSKSIEVVQTAFNAAVKIEVEKRLATTTPKSSKSNPTTGMTKEEFNKLTLKEQGALAVSDKELYLQLTKQ